MCHFAQKMCRVPKIHQLCQNFHRGSTDCSFRKSVSTTQSWISSGSGWHVKIIKIQPAGMSMTNTSSHACPCCGTFSWLASFVKRTWWMKVGKAIWSFRQSLPKRKSVSASGGCCMLLSEFCQCATHEATVRTSCVCVSEKNRIWLAYDLLCCPLTSPLLVFLLHTRPLFSPRHPLVCNSRR